MVHTYDIYPSSSSTCIESDEKKRYWQGKTQIKPGQKSRQTWTKFRQILILVLVIFSNQIITSAEF